MPCNVSRNYEISIHTFNSIVIRTTDLKPDQINSHLFISRLSSSVYLATTFAMDQYIVVSLSKRLQKFYCAIRLSNTYLLNFKFNVIVLLSIGMSPVFFFLFLNDDFTASDAASETKLGIE